MALAAKKKFDQGTAELLALIRRGPNLQLSLLDQAESPAAPTPAAQPEVKAEKPEESKQSAADWQLIKLEEFKVISAPNRKKLSASGVTTLGGFIESAEDVSTVWKD